MDNILISYFVYNTILMILNNYQEDFLYFAPSLSYLYNHYSKMGTDDETNFTGITLL